MTAERDEAALAEEMEVALAVGAFLLARNHESAGPFGRLVATVLKSDGEGVLDSEEDAWAAR